MAEYGRRRRILAHVGQVDAPVHAGRVAEAVCRYAVDQLAASSCGVMLMSPPSSLDVLAASDPLAVEVAELQFSLGEGPCLDAYTLGRPVFATDLAGFGAQWPVFAAAAADLGALAEFSLPLQVGAAGLGTLDLYRSEPGMLDDEQLADALVAAELVTDAVLMMPTAGDGADLARAFEPGGIDKLAVHQATGMVAVQADVSTADALARLRAAAFQSGRSIRDVAVDVVNRRVTFRD